MNSDTEGLVGIANSKNPSRAADIVFVHGLGGTSHSSWTYDETKSPNKFFWPEELGKDLPNFGIWTVGYLAGKTNFAAPGMRIAKRAGNLAQKLANAEMGDRPIIFVCHSMGGLVVKHLVVDSQTLADADRKNIAKAVKAIVFCATPHRGSAYSDAAVVLGKYFAPPQVYVEEMRREADDIGALHEKFVEWQRNNPILIDTYAENMGLKKKNWMLRLVDLPVVVSKTSADTGIAGFSVKDVDEDHISIVKPSGRGHDVYAGVLRFIRRTVPETSATPMSASVSEETVVATTSMDGHAAKKEIDLAFSVVGVPSRTTAVAVSVCVTTDEPKELVVRILAWKQKISADALQSASGPDATGMSLIDLVDSPRTRGRMLEWLATTPFSAYVYYARRDELENVSEADLMSRFFVEPLVHRLSKKAEEIKAVHWVAGSFKVSGKPTALLPRRQWSCKCPSAAGCRRSTASTGVG